MTGWGDLPEGCTANILSFTTPRDACRLSLVSSAFRSAAGSDALWERFLPSDYQTIISRSNNTSLLNFSSTRSKKDLFFRLCHNPILIDNGKKSFSLDRKTGKKCYMIAARDLYIEWGDTPIYWTWPSFPESRFKEVAQLDYVWWLELRGKINTHMLSPLTNYVAYLVFKMMEDAYGFEEEYPARISVGIVGAENRCTRNACLDLFTEHGDVPELVRPEERNNGWFEIELGEFYNDCEDDCVLDMSIMEVEAGIEKGGLIVQGIEIRPKGSSSPICLLQGPDPSDHRF